MIHQKSIKKDPQRISKLQSYINQYKKFEQNNKEIDLNVLFVPHNKKEIEAAYTSKYNYKCKKKLFC